ncbi:unnamed protein product [Orchesella dallaii]|uniref:Diacylglycerol O-acyltransferase n=1 Tax=Orchesella dallaii TaxID=48710 RepID=A0ABP1SAY9_9HEXA
MNQLSKLQRSLELLQIILIFIFIILLPLIWVPCYIYRLLIILLAKTQPKIFGKIFSFADAFLDEDFARYPPKSSIITTMLIQGNLSVDWLRQHFDNSVLQSKLGKSLRYPELQQYPVNFLGQRFWKWDSKFKIETHIKEETPTSMISCNNNSLEFDLATIHEELLNKPFQKEASPWELLLFPSGQQETLLVLRLHHVLGDAKSILKLLVECLGGQPLETALPHQIQLSPWEKFLSTLLLPINYTFYLFQLGECAITSHFHPWKVSHFNENSSKLVVGLSEQLPLTKLKKTAKEKEVTTSSLLLSIITRSIQTCFPHNNQKIDLGIGYILPKPLHPPFYLSNHVHMGMLHLPMLTSNKNLNLNECHRRFLHLKKSELFKYTDFTAFQLGTLPNPLRNIVARNFYSASGVTNIAGEKQGFSLGNGGSWSCSQMSMSVGTLPGGAGLIFCIFSYKEDIQVAIIANENIMNKEEAKKLANQIEIQFYK